MIDAAIWLLRWTLAGAALSVLVIAFVYMFERAGRRAEPALFRATMLAALAAPLIAFIPPVFTFSASATSAEPGPLAPRFIESREQRPVGELTAGAEPEPASAAAAVLSVDALAASLIAMWAAGAASAAIFRQRSYSRLERAFRTGAAFPSSCVECRLSTEVAGPLLFGVLRPRMLAPSNFRDWPHAEREAVLRHEAAHAKRGDLVWALIGDLAVIAYWWAPPVRFLVARHTLATEEACDAVSFAHSEDRHDYARALLAVARRVGGHASPGLAMTASSLRRRVERLISPDSKNGSAFSLPVIAAGAATGMVLALSAPAAAGANSYRMYIFAAADSTESIYAVSDGGRAAAAAVVQCVGRLLPNAAAIVDEFEGRIRNGRENELNPVWIVGPGSRTELGSCREKAAADEDSGDEPDKDSLVLITDASEKQARRFIRQIDALSRSQRREMAAELGLE